MSEEEKDDLQHIHRLLFQDLKFCGCGDPEAVYELVRDLLELFGERTDYIRSLSPGEWATGGPRTCEQVRERITNSEAAYYAILYWLDGADLLEHGGSVGASWLTEKGYHYLGLMRAHEYRDMEEKTRWVTRSSSGCRTMTRISPGMTPLRASAVPGADTGRRPPRST